MLRLSRPADEVIGQRYLKRWHLRRRPGGYNLYLHRYEGSDDDRALHDHPWRSVSVLLWGRLIEVTADGRRAIMPFWPKFRSATDAHRLELHSKFALTLFFTFPKEREWGFLSSNGWTHWRDYAELEEPKSVLADSLADTDKAS